MTGVQTLCSSDLLHLSTAGKSLKGSYPNVDNEQDRAYYAEHPKEALWWVKERKN